MNALKEKLKRMVKANKLTEAVAKTLQRFFSSYLEAAQKNGYGAEEILPLLETLANHVAKQLAHPYHFEPYHKHVLKPFDFYKFGHDLIRPLMDLNRSSIRGIEVVNRIQDLLEQGHNAILLANHQTEPDPQVISILLENTHPQIAKQLISVAGHRVITDPLAVPFSKGLNLLCIYSKKHIENPPELKAEKLIHNQRTMKKMSALLAKGGKCIYVAPSGGRDRPDANGKVNVAPFDPQSIDFFMLMAQKAKTPTHFFPLALSTYHLLPPPNSVEKEIGERRHANSVPVHVSFGEEIDFSEIQGDLSLTKQEKRQRRAEHIWGLVDRDYKTLIN